MTAPKLTDEQVVFIGETFRYGSATSEFWQFWGGWTLEITEAKCEPSASLPVRDTDSLAL